MDIPLQNKIKQHFDGMYQAGVTPWKDHAPEPALTTFLALLKNKQPKAKVLDIGCGDGWISIQTAQASFEVWGLDSSGTAIARAKKTAEEKGMQDKTHFETGDVLDLPYKPEFFDALIDRGLFHHILPENRRLYKENILHVLKKQSWMYLAVFSMHNPKGIGQQFTKETITELFSPPFEIIHYEEDPYPTRNPAHLLHFILNKTA